MRKFLRLFSLSILPLALTLLSFPASAQDAPGLPDVPGWGCSELRETRLNAVSSNQGTWFQRDYRTAASVTIRATLMTGKGPGMLRFPPENPGSNDGPLGSGCTYRTLEIGGREAVVETHPLLGVSVFMSLDDGYLTLESGGYGFSENDVVPAAAALLGAM